MTWRPRDWQGFKEECYKVGPDGFESGADAMLKALRQSGIHLAGNVPTNNSGGLVQIGLSLQNIAQTIIVIPDKDSDKVCVACRKERNIKYYVWSSAGYYVGVCSNCFTIKEPGKYGETLHYEKFRNA